ncbi:MAG: M20 family metallo-hydrolase [Firmicutes bacterium]|nr:M20 family metallo-hydrolase [Bacillota bacterium]
MVEKKDSSNKESKGTELMKAAEQMEQICIALRRDFHTYPEAAWNEFRTTAKVAQRLRKMGMKVVLGKEVIQPDFAFGRPDEEELKRQQRRAIEQGAEPELVEEMEGYTGAMAVIDTGRKGPAVALRFDMDCVEVQETDHENHSPNRQGFASVNEGWMHACGHDGHTAMGLVLTEILWRHKDALQGRIKILFQPAEEGVRGARAMVERGLLDDVDVVLGIHIYGTEEPYPALAGTQTGLYATTKFDVTIHGRNAHAGGAPQEGHNALLAAVTAISAMNGFLQDGRGAERLNIGLIRGGSGRNVVPADCTFCGETRGSDTAVEQRLFDRMKACVEGACRMFECENRIVSVGAAPAGGGDEDLAARIVAAAQQQVEDMQWTEPIQVNTGTTDDFAYMMKQVQERGGKACYLALLSKLTEGLHGSGYDFDETCLIPGVKSLLAALSCVGIMGDQR